MPSNLMQFYTKPKHVDDDINLNSNSNDKEYSIEEILFILRKHLKAIITIFFLFVFATIYYTLIIKSEYKSSSTILISDEKNSMSK